MELNLKTIVYEEKDDILFICINLPPANKMIPLFLIEIAEVIRELILKSQLSGVILYGNGRHFSSGADIDELLGFIKDNIIVKDKRIVKYPLWYEDCKQSFRQMYHCNIPVISAIRGFCIGSGLELALASHIRICEYGARIGLPETTFDLMPGIDGTLRLAQEAGVFHAFEMILKGQLMTSEEALKRGVVNLLVPKKSALVYAVKLIKYISDNCCDFKSEKQFVLLKEFSEMCFKTEEGMTHGN